MGNAVFFSVYEYVRYYMHSHVKAASSNHSNLIDMGVGILTGGVALWLAIFPLDIAKTTIQTAPDESSSKNPFRVLSSVLVLL
ncbi:Mitochondrial arginine transporter BAC1 [Quillaja saponaria]|uniref:Mitochondrial arginine transporter BAC1 n=1 Tax=Quillaja saponaria TaxID=32244 RepID=A0AAD7M299_QUISA|nr:Mitochondrial arginine transporter BAC1 [Quillaja saponaria]